MTGGMLGDNTGKVGVAILADCTFVRYCMFVVNA